MSCAATATDAVRPDLPDGAGPLNGLIDAFRVLGSAISRDTTLVVGGAALVGAAGLIPGVWRLVDWIAGPPDGFRDA